MAMRLPIWTLCVFLACVQRERPAETVKIGEWSENASNGQVVASMHRGDLVISRNGREAARLALAPSIKARHFLFFTPDGMLRVYPQQRFEPLTTHARPQIAEILTIDVEHLRIVQRCRVSSAFPGLYLRPSVDGSRLIALEKQRTHISLYSGDGCQKIGDLATTGKLRAAAFSPDGGVAAVFASAGSALFARYDRMGHLEWSTPLQGSTGDAVVFVSSDGSRSLVGLNPFARVDRRWSGAWKLFRVDQNAITPASPSSCAPERALDFWGSPALSAGIDHIVLQCADGPHSLKL